MKIFEEIKRRKVGKVAVSYAIIAWIILQVASIVAPALTLPDWSISLTLYLLVIGFPLSLVAAWIYEITPEGVKRDEADQSSKSSTSKPISIGILVALAGAAIVWNYTSSDQKRELFSLDLTPSIAVLPFQNFSSDPEQDYFVDGLSEEILNYLAKSRNLRVIARTSSFAYRGQNRDMREIGQELDVSHLLEGSVRKDGDQIRVTAQLIRVDDGSHIWSETYDRQFINIFSIQEDVSANIANVINQYLVFNEDADNSHDPVVPATNDILVGTVTQSHDAQDDYLRGLYLYNKAIQNVDQVDLQGAIEKLKNATELDPNYASAWIALAEAYNKATSFTFGYIPRLDGLQLASNAAFRAIEINPNLGGAWRALGEANMGYNGSMATIDKFTALEKAVELNPNDAGSLALLAFALRGNDNKTFIDYAKRAYELDPFNRNAASNYALSLTYQGQFQKADQFIRSWSQNGETSPFALNYLGLNTFLAYDIPALVSIAKELEAKNETGAPAIRHFITEAYLTLGMDDEAEKWSIPQSDFFIDYARGDFQKSFNRLQILNATDLDVLRDQNLSDFWVVHSFYVQVGAAANDIPLVEREVADHREGEPGAFFAKIMSATNYRYRHAGLLETKEAWLLNAQSNQAGAIKAAEAGLAQIAQFRKDGFARPDFYYEEARLYAQMNNIDAALNALDMAISHGYKSWEIKVDPLIDPLRTDARFILLMQRYDTEIISLRASIEEEFFN